MEKPQTSAPPLILTADGSPQPPTDAERKEALRHLIAAQQRAAAAHLQKTSGDQVMEWDGVFYEIKRVTPAKGEIILKAATAPVLHTIMGRNPDLLDRFVLGVMRKGRVAP